MSDAPPKAAPRRWPLALAIAGVAALALLLALYAARRTLAREALTAWLRSHGVESAAAIQAVGPGALSGSIALGDPRRPDFSAERVEVGYGLRGLRLEVRSVRLVRPVLRARLHAGRLSAGTLDPLIESLTRGRPSPNAPRPTIVVEGGRLQLATDDGPLEIEGDARVASGRLQRLAAHVAPARLHGQGFDASFGRAALSLQTVGGRAELSLDAPAVTAAAGEVTAQNARLRITAVGPYPDVARRREDGAVAAHAELSAARLAFRGQALQGGLVSAALTGRAAGWIDDLVVEGAATADVRATSVQAAGGTAGPLRLAAGLQKLRWTRQGGDVVRGELAATASLDSFAAGDARVAQATGALRGPVTLSGRGAAFQLIASALGHGAWQGLSAPGAGDSAEIAAAKRAARGFRFAAPAVAVERAGGVVRARLVQPVRLSPDAGGTVTLAADGAGWRLASAGGDLPRIDAAVRRFSLAPGGATAAGRIRAALSVGPIEHGAVDAAGTLRLADGRLAFLGERCARLSAARLAFGGHDVTGVSGRLCPAGGPLVAFGAGGWRIAGQAQGVAGEATFLQAKLAAAAGPVAMGARGRALYAQARFDAEASDAAPQTRFRPVDVSGEARLADGLWTSGLAIRDRAGRPLATVRLRHEDATGRGGLRIETGTVRFAPGGLQPAELSPFASLIGSPAAGAARFSGAFSWTAKTQESSGVLEIPGLDFQSPAGKVGGLSGRIVFSSLAPLVAPPGQVLQAASVAAAIAPLGQARAVFGLTPEALEVESAQAAVGGGVVRIAQLEVPFGAARPLRGVLRLEGVQLHDLVAASPFGDRVALDARVSGEIPFTVQGEKVRVAGGSLQAVQPGRLSIQRSALSGVEATGAVAAPGAPAAAAPLATTDTFSDFAYQAMENLAFSQLSATVDSRPDGRLGVVFHIVGKHDPPQHQEIRIGLFDLLGKKFLGRKLPLPSGTGVDLTLDTTLNLDDLVSDYAEFRRLHGSAQVQP